MFVFDKVRKSNSSTSIKTLQSAVEETVSHLEQQGLLSGERLGQIFSSVSDMINLESDQDQREDRSKVRERHFNWKRPTHCCNVHQLGV